MEKIKVALLFGGVSSEHEISRVSCATFLRSLNREKYAVTTVGITKDGRWLQYFDGPEDMENGHWERHPSNRKCILSPDRADHCFIARTSAGVDEYVPVDVVIPVLHGRNGEDGTMQGLLELAGIPYVGCGVLSSAACMDKSVANTLFDAAGVPHCKWKSCLRHEAKDFDRLERWLLETLQYPIFVKPANAGSSVGISKAHNREELEAAIHLALLHDDRVVFEEFITGQEVECAVLGNTTPSATRPGEILAGAEFYTYDDKYKDGVSQTRIPARLSEEKQDEVKNLAVQAYRALSCSGLARCDFFVEADTGRVLINEINTMPGFTAISMYPKLMEAAGLPLTALIDTLIELAFERAGV